MCLTLCVTEKFKDMAKCKWSRNCIEFEDKTQDLMSAPGSNSSHARQKWRKGVGRPTHLHYDYHSFYVRFPAPPLPVVLLPAYNVCVVLAYSTHPYIHLSHRVGRDDHFHSCDSQLGHIWCWETSCLPMEWVIHIISFILFLGKTYYISYPVLEVWTKACPDDV